MDPVKLANFVLKIIQLCAIIDEKLAIYMEDPA